MDIRKLATLLIKVSEILNQKENIKIDSNWLNIKTDEIHVYIKHDYRKPEKKVSLTFIFDKNGSPCDEEELEMGD